MSNVAYSSIAPCAVTAGLNASVVGPSTSSSLNLQPPTGGTSSAIKKSYSLGSGAGQVGIAIDEIITAAASSSVTVNYNSISEVLGNAAQALTKLKAFIFWLLSATDDTVNGTAASAVVVQGGSSNPNLLTLGGTTPTYTINNGGFWEHCDITAGGITVSPTVCNVKFANSDSGNAMAVRVQSLGY